MPGSGKELAVQTLNDWIDRWLEEVLPNVVKGTTIRMYAETMEHHVRPLLGGKTLEEMTEQTVKNWVQTLSSAPVAGTRSGHMAEGTVRNILSVLSGCMRDAQKYGLIAKNPCPKSAWTLKSKNVGEHQAWLSEEDVRRLEPLLANYEDEDGYPIGFGFRLVLYTGITLSEAAALRWKDVDFKENKLCLNYFVAVQREKGDRKDERRYELEKLTGRKRREVPAPGFLMRELRQIQKQYVGGPEDFVLRSSGKEPVQMDRMRAALLRRGRSCGMGAVTPRMLRDTYAMRAVHAGANSDTIAELMGFASSRQVIRRYMPKSVTDKRELMKKMFGED